MSRIARFGSIGGLVAVALVAHLWMFPAFDGPSSLHAETTGTAVDTPLTTACASGMAACVAAGAEELRPSLAVAVGTLPALPFIRRRRRSTQPPARSSGHGPGRPLSPVDEGVLLLE